MAADLAALGGQLRLQPGRPRPQNLRSTRVDWAARLAQGRLASSLPATLASLYSLCSHAQGLCAGMALAAAQGTAVADADALPVRLRRRLAMQTLREHVQRLWLADAGPAAADAGAAGHALRQLAHSPVLAPEPEPAAVARWLQAELFGEPLADWLAAWEGDPEAALAAWHGAGRTPAARALRQQLAAGARAPDPGPLAAPLRAHAEADDRLALARALRDEPGFAMRPRWRGAAAETGCWTRLNDDAGAALPPTLPRRLGARLAEIARLALPAAPARRGDGWLALGALPLGAGEAIAWVEMSRGLLVHHLQIEGRGDAARVVACHVLAPTEWNFHPDGSVARLLAVLPEAGADDAKDTLGAWLLAYDPCVPFELEPAVTDRRETDHA